jgi:hypothetical protein
MKNLEEFSKRINLPLDFLSDIKNAHKHYKIHKIKKKGQKEKRTIYEPIFEIKVLQKWILEEILNEQTLYNKSFAFRKNTIGILKNAEYHLPSRYVCTIDIKDFFPSIKEKRIQNYFRSLGFENSLVDFLVKITSYKGMLPQGAVTSPCISNLIFYEIDQKIDKACNSARVKYSRYADDLTFSGDDKQILHHTVQECKSIILKYCFKINNSKTRFFSPVSHKIINGLTLDNYQNIKVQKKLKNKIRLEIYFSEKNKAYKNLEQIQGYISFIHSIETNYIQNCLEYLNKLDKKFLHEWNSPLKERLMKIVKKH